MKEAAGKATGDAKLEIEGRNEKAAGKVQNAVGGVKDAVRDALKKKTTRRHRAERPLRRDVRQSSRPRDIIMDMSTLLIIVVVVL